MTKFLTTVNSIQIQVETNYNKNLRVSERVQVLCFGEFQLETNLVTDSDEKGNIFDIL